MGLSGSILITGGSGTLGQAIVRTAVKENWDCSFTIYSRSELRQAQMRARYPHCRYVLGDVRDYDRLSAAVAGHDLVIHAAAMKRIPECEQHPAECYATNVQGSANVVRACLAGNVKRCVGISTDKACRAITAYGASKLMLEKLFQAAPEGPCAFTLVRYGNVVASNGSVIPLWRQQAARGEALTITDPEMTRFWMAESEAVRVVVHAAVLSSRGAIYVPKMGALSIVEMADIVAPGVPHVVTGLRSTEKQHEDLIHVDEVVTESERSFVVWPPRWLDAMRGASYTSYAAPRLTREQFLAMLHEAEAHE
jgi:UDP-N-acetylglucosamine 4,6-dehydratase/5-epimerase